VIEWTVRMVNAADHLTLTVTFVPRPVGVCGQYDCGICLLTNGTFLLQVPEAEMANGPSSDECHHHVPQRGEIDASENSREVSLRHL
jgi:hypothetical protein